jgi:methylmalonyl-CoA mutase cobalamin-binding subunit
VDTDDVNVTCSVDDEHLAEIADVAEALRRGGMQVEQVYAELGLVTGSVPPGRQAALTAVPGVVEVTQQLPVQLPPPDAPIQ